MCIRKRRGLGDLEGPSLPLPRRTLVKEPAQRLVGLEWGIQQLNEALQTLGIECKYRAIEQHLLGFFVGCFQHEIGPCLALHLCRLIDERPLRSRGPQVNSGFACSNSHDWLLPKDWPLETAWLRL